MLKGFTKALFPSLISRGRESISKHAELLFSDIKKIAEQVEVGGKTDILALLTELETEIRVEETEGLPLKRSASAKDFYDWLYNPGILTVNYSINFRGDT